MAFIKIDNKYINPQNIVYIETSDMTAPYSPNYIIQFNFNNARPISLTYDTAAERDAALEQIMSDIDEL